MKNYAMVEAVYARAVWNRFFEQVPFRRVVNPFGIVYVYEMVGMLLTCDNYYSLYLIPESFAQLLAEKQGKPDIPAGKRESNRYVL